MDDRIRRFRPGRRRDRANVAPGPRPDELALDDAPGHRRRRGRGLRRAAVGLDPSAGLTAWIAAIAGSVLLLVGYHMMTAPAARALDSGGPATNADYKRAAMDDLSRGPNG